MGLDSPWSRLSCWQPVAPSGSCTGGIVASCSDASTNTKPLGLPPYRCSTCTRTSFSGTSASVQPTRDTMKKQRKCVRERVFDRMCDMDCLCVCLCARASSAAALAAAGPGHRTRTSSAGRPRRRSARATAWSEWTPATCPRALVQLGCLDPGCRRPCHHFQGPGQPPMAPVGIGPLESDSSREDVKSPHFC